jgi:hypothetical protein
LASDRKDNKLFLQSDGQDPRRDLQPYSTREEHRQGQEDSLLKDSRPTQHQSRNRTRSTQEERSSEISSISVMDSGSKTPLTPKERIDLVRAELESIRASTNQQKWDLLKFEMEDLKDELSDEIHVGLKDAANLMGDLGKRLCNLEQKVEELTTTFSKISEASAEAATSTGNKGNR